MLDVIDVDPGAQAVYEVLVDGSPATFGELRTAVAFGPGRLRSALATLEEKGLVSRLTGTPVRFVAASPDVALGVLFLDKEKQLNRGRLYVEQLAARFHQTADRREVAELVEVVTGRAAIQQRFEQLQRTAREQIRGIDRPPYSVPAATLNPVEAELLGRGVRYRIIYDTAALEFHPLYEDLDASTAQGEEARVLANTPTKLVLVDDQFGMIPLLARPTEIEGLVVVHPSGLFEALSALFEVLWQQALPLCLPGGQQQERPASPSADDRRLLALLTAGLPDEAIARQIGVSYRTLQRRIRTLMHRLGAQTRFQAGLRAQQLGWVTPSPARTTGTGLSSAGTL